MEGFSVRYNRLLDCCGLVRNRGRLTAMMLINRYPKTTNYNWLMKDIVPGVKLPELLALIDAHSPLGLPKSCTPGQISVWLLKGGKAPFKMSKVPDGVLNTLELMQILGSAAHHMNIDIAKFSLQQIELIVQQLDRHSRASARRKSTALLTELTARGTLSP